MSQWPDFMIVIPARMASTRLPGKPLQALAGEPLIIHVARRALASGAREVWVATDDARIARAVDGLEHVQVAMTRADHLSGTDRLAECAERAGWADDQMVINVQGDEPFVPVAGIRAVATTLLDARTVSMSTLAAPIHSRAELFDPNAVKVVCDGGGHALYFSRAPVPWPRDQATDPVFPGPWLRHIGIYAYRAGFLRKIAALPPGQLEQVESLEQLRVLEAGYRIAVGLTPEPFPPGVDTADDLARAEAFLRRGRTQDIKTRETL